MFSRLTADWPWRLQQRNTTSVPLMNFVQEEFLNYSAVIRRTPYLQRPLIVIHIVVSQMRYQSGINQVSERTERYVNYYQSVIFVLAPPSYILLAAKSHSWNAYKMAKIYNEILSDNIQLLQFIGIVDIFRILVIRDVLREFSSSYEGYHFLKWSSCSVRNYASSFSVHFKKGGDSQVVKHLLFVCVLLLLFSKTIFLSI